MKKLLLLLFPLFLLGDSFYENLLIEIKDQSGLYKMNRINMEINLFKYISDVNNYGKSEHWASPQEFLISKGGDCEDFAIAKADLLIKSGFDVNKIFFGIVTFEKHAVLLVELDSHIFILDNQVKIPRELNDEKMVIVGFEEMMAKKRA